MMSHTETDYHKLQKRNVQICRTPSNELWQKLYFLSNMIIFFAAPLLVIVILYTFIVRSLCNNELETLLNGFGIIQSAQRHRKQVIVMLLSVMVLFFVCVLPFRVLSMWLIFASEQTVRNMNLDFLLKVLNFTRVMFYLNSAGNPILYNVFSTRFRRAFRLLCVSRKSHTNVTSNSTLTRHSHKHTGS